MIVTSGIGLLDCPHCKNTLMEYDLLLNVEYCPRCGHRRYNNNQRNRGRPGEVTVLERRLISHMAQYESISRLAVLTGRSRNTIRKIIQGRLGR